MDFAGFGTVVNVISIIIGGIIGLIFGRFVSKNLQETLQKSCAVVVIFLGIAGTLSKMMKIHSDGTIEIIGTMMMIASLSIGSIIGEMINIEGKMEKFGVYLRKKSRNDGDSKFVNGFITASLTVCIGAMAIIGAIEDSLLHNYTILYAKSILDLILIMIFTISLGKGCIFSAISVGIFQGIITIIAGFLQQFMTDLTINNISYVGNILIFCVGINLMFGQKIRVANLLPAIIIAAIYN